MYCKNCGEKIEKEDYYCSSCGIKLRSKFDLYLKELLKKIKEILRINYV